MMRLSFWVILMVLVVSGHAQPMVAYDICERYDFNMYYIFADTAQIKKTPSFGSETLSVLHAGDEIFVLKHDDVGTTQNGVIAPWLHVAYRKGDEVLQGHIWAGSLSFGALEYGGVKFVHGIKNVQVTNIDDDFGGRTYQMELKAVRRNSIITVDTFSMSGSGPYFKTEIMESKGLDNVNCICAITFGGAACGIPSLTYAHIWGFSDNLVSLPVLMVDAGSYYHGENFIFPDDKNGKKGKIIQKITEVEVVFTRKGVEKEKTKNERKIYCWDGEGLF